MTDQDIAAIFAYWYKWSGHWMHSSREDAIRVWRQWGIEALPSWTAGAEKLLAA